MKNISISLGKQAEGFILLQIDSINKHKSPIRFDKVISSKFDLN